MASRQKIILTLIICGLCSVLGSQAVSQAKKDGQEGFVKSLSRLQKLGKTGRWAQIAKSIDRLMDAHEMQPYVIPHRETLLQLATMAEFRKQFPEPKAKEVVSGDLKSWNARTGRIKIRYKNDINNGLGDDWSKGSHFGGFKGPHTIEISGDQYPKGDGGAAIVFCASDDVAYRVFFGQADTDVGYQIEYAPAVLQMIKGDTIKQLDYKKISPAIPNRNFRLTLKVKNSSISAAFNGKTILTGRKSRKHWGRMAYANCDPDLITLAGEMEPSWIQRLVDQRDSQQRDKFEKAKGAKGVLPAWVFDDSLVANVDPSKAPSKKLEDWPEPLSKVHSEISDHAHKLLKDGKPNAAFKYVEAQDKSALPGWLQSFLLATCARAKGDLEGGRKHIQNALSAKPDFDLARLVEGDLLLSLREFKPAIAAFKKLAQSYPDDPNVIVPYIEALMAGGKLKEAGVFARAAIGRGVSDKSVKGLSSLIAQAERGPPWTKTYSFTSQHYEVISDINKETCKDAAKILEESYLSYSVSLKRLPNSKQRFRVLLFSGEIGYAEYCTLLWGGAPQHTAGLYDPRLKQLLIWNLPNRDAMMRTVRHEGWHQFLDRIMDSPPKWFNEGFAEYYETAELSSSGKWQLGKSRPDHLDTLLSSGVMPLAGFLHRSPKNFMTRAGIHYAQAWAFIHFLHHGPKQYRDLLPKFWDGFARTPDPAIAIDQALTGVNFKSLEAAFGRHVRSLK